MRGQASVSFWFFTLMAAGVLVGQDVCGLLLGALLHELGHLAAMLSGGGRIDRLEIGAFGAKIIPRYVGIPSTALELSVLLAGPAAGLAAGGVSALLGASGFAEINWLLSGFNLLPLPGLDGGSVLALALESRFGERGERAAGVIGLAAGALLLIVILGYAMLKPSAI